MSEPQQEPTADYYTVVFRVPGTRGYTDPYTHEKDAERKAEELRNTEGVTEAHVFDYEAKAYADDRDLINDGVCPVCGDEFVDGFDELEEGETHDARVCIVEHAEMLDHGQMLVHLEENDAGD